MLDNPEMELTLQELGAAPSDRLTQTLQSPDLLTEYASCASLIMDKQERESVAAPAPECAAAFSDSSLTRLMAK